MGGGRYVAMRVSQQDCAAQHFDSDGLPRQCDQKPVWELVHSEGPSFHVCEYHIEALWNVWIGFRNAMQDLWPVNK